MRISTLYLLSGAVLSAPSLAAQTAAPAAYVQLGVEEEVALARSAAPAEVSNEATVWRLQDGAYTIAEQGSNGNHCFVMRSMELSLEPICYDEEASATVLLWEFRWHELRMAGHSREQIQQQLDQDIQSGRLAVPSRPAMAYMMSSGQRLYSTQGQRIVGNWKPHIMLYSPGLTNETFGLSQPTPSMFVVHEGTPRALAIIVVPEFIEPGT